ncbi:MAG: DUF2490 domain-containing protein [Bacteroidota bacterium]
MVYIRKEISERTPFRRDKIHLNPKRTILIGPLIFALIFLAKTVDAQEKSISRGEMTWLQYYNKTTLSESWMWKTDAGYRWTDFFEESKQFITRTSIGYALNPLIRISAGFAYLGYYTSGNMNRVEYRPYQEMTLMNDFQYFDISHRYRLEERFSRLTGNKGDENSGNFNFRFRYAFMLKIPVLKLSATNPQRKLVLNIGDEIFLNAGNEIVSNLFNQNRFIISPGIQFNKNLSLHLTWNSLFASKAESAKYNHFDVFWVQVKHGSNISIKR